MMKLAILLMLPAALWAETGSEAWLRYTRTKSAGVPDVVAVLGDASAIAGQRLQCSPARDGRSFAAFAGHGRQDAARRIRHSAGRRDRPRHARCHPRSRPQWRLAGTIAPDGYWLKTFRPTACSTTVVTAANDRGVLYGAFALLRKIQLGESIANLDERETPYAPVRWVNQWDNLDGSIERGYGGRSIFWDNMHARADLTRVGDYGRLLASLGINGCSINNVNANPKHARAGSDSRHRAHRRRLASLGRAHRPLGRFRQSAKRGRPRHFRSARPSRGRVVESAKPTKSTAPFPISAASS